MVLVAVLLPQQEWFIDSPLSSVAAAALSGAVVAVLSWPGGFARAATGGQTNIVMPYRCGRRLLKQPRRLMLVGREAWQNAGQTIVKFCAVVLWCESSSIVVLLQRSSRCSPICLTGRVHGGGLCRRSPSAARSVADPVTTEGQFTRPRARLLLFQPLQWAEGACLAALITAGAYWPAWSLPPRCPATAGGGAGARSPVSAAVFSSSFRPRPPAGVTSAVRQRDGRPAAGDAGMFGGTLCSATRHRNVARTCFCCRSCCRWSC